MTRGFFIALEGGEGAGKSTQARRLADALRATGREVVVTREPGGSAGAEEIRALLVTGAAARWSPLTEALLMYAAREDHLNQTIRPALARGAVVISDRFADSSEAYQGGGGGVPPETLAALRAAVVGTDEPDITLVFDLPAEVGLARAAARGGDARFESKGAAYHQRLRDAYLEIAARRKDSAVLIDATKDVEAVAEAIRLRVFDALDRRGV